MLVSEQKRWVKAEQAAAKAEADEKAAAAEVPPPPKPFLTGRELSRLMRGL